MEQHVLILLQHQVTQASPTSAKHYTVCARWDLSTRQGSDSHFIAVKFVVSNVAMAASESTGSLVDVGTLAATARALSDGCQPFDFAGWGTSAISRSAALSSINSGFPSASTDQRQHSRTLQPLPEVLSRPSFV